MLSIHAHDLDRRSISKILNLYAIEITKAVGGTPLLSIELHDMHAPPSLPMPSANRFRWWRFAPLGASTLLLGGCQMAPSQVIFGTSFPDWMFCMLGGVTLTMLTHSVLRKSEKLDWLAPLPVSYIATTIIYSVLIWIYAFQR